MWKFGVQAALLIGSKLLIGLYLPTALALGGWQTTALLFIFAFAGRRIMSVQNR
jgi:hypothetical protein